MLTNDWPRSWAAPGGRRPAVPFSVGIPEALARSPVGETADGQSQVGGHGVGVFPIAAVGQNLSASLTYQVGEGHQRLELASSEQFVVGVDAVIGCGDSAGVVR